MGKRNFHIIFDICWLSDRRVLTKFRLLLLSTGPAQTLEVITAMGSNCSSGLLSCLGKSHCNADASSLPNRLKILGEDSSKKAYSNGAGGDGQSLVVGVAVEKILLLLAIWQSLFMLLQI